MCIITGDPASVVLLHWGDPGVEREEIDEIRMLVESYGYPTPEVCQREGLDICECRVLTPTPDAFEEGLASVLRRNPGVQILYITAHGDRNGLAFSRTAILRVPYSRVAAIIRANTDDGALEIVLGSCQAMDYGQRIEGQFPPQVRSIIGFADQPDSTEVAELMGGVLNNSLALFRQLRQPGQLHFAEAATRANGSPSVADVWRVVVEHHLARPEVLIQQPHGRWLVTATRDPEHDGWSRALRELEQHAPGLANEA